MRFNQRSIRDWFNITNNSTPAESKIKTPIPPPLEELVEEKLELSQQDVEVIANELENPTPPNEELVEAVKENKKRKNEE